MDFRRLEGWIEQGKTLIENRLHEILRIGTAKRRLLQVSVFDIASGQLTPCRLVIDPASVTRRGPV